MAERFDALVVGSGFGGAALALRLAEAGAGVVVLERGRRWRPQDFPRDLRATDALFWGFPRHPNRKGRRGLYDVRFHSGLATVSASGVGGGSLVYANILIRPDGAVFERPRWPTEIRRESLEPHFDRVAVELEPTPLPAGPNGISLKKREAFHRAAKTLGRQVFDPPQAVAWSQAPGPGRSACILCAECEFGCRHGAKHTLDFTYLARAEQCGAEIRPGACVTYVEPVESGYRVHYRDLSTGAARSIDARVVALSAGTLGTNEILLASRDRYRTLPGLSATLGHGFSANGDFLGSLGNADADLEPWRGPDVTSVMRFGEETGSAGLFTLAAPTFNRAVMEALAPRNGARVPKLGWLAPVLWRWMGTLLPLAFRTGLVSRMRGAQTADAARTTMLFAIGQDDSSGVVRLTPRGVDIEWDYGRCNWRLIEAMQAAFQDVARALGGKSSLLWTWELFHKILTVHPLGGCALSDTAELGVVSPRGEVHGYPGLFVADGSVIPCSIGFHPAMTIAAVSERIAEAAVERFQERAPSAVPKAALPERGTQRTVPQTPR